MKSQIPFGASRFVEDIMGETVTRNILGGLEIQINEKEWVRGQRIFENLPKALHRAVLRGQMEFANRYHMALLENIRNNGKKIGWEAYSKRYTYQKRWMASSSKHPDVIHGPEEKFRLTGKAVRAIKVYPNRKANVVSIGISAGDGELGMNDRYTVSQYVHIFEKGSTTRNIKARPLFAPVYKQIGGKKAVSSAITQAINEEIQLLLKF